MGRCTSERDHSANLVCPALYARGLRTPHVGVSTPVLTATTWRVVMPGFVQGLWLCYARRPMRPLEISVGLMLAACGNAGPTWHRDVRPIIEGRCTNCHVEGGIAPFALTSYANAKTYGAALTANVKAGTMPPWKAGAADVGSLRNPALTDAQKSVIQKWFDDGMRDCPDV